MEAVHLMEQRHMRWYNPKLEDFEWREDKSDKEVLSFLESLRDARAHSEVYRE
jgi:hypothetical protein